MDISRRGFTGGALSLAIAGPLAAPGFAQSRPELEAALSAVRTYGEAHVRAFGLPGLTLAVMTAEGFSTVFNFGFADATAKTPITPDTLFQVGSISKLMTAALIHQFASEGRLRLDAQIDGLLPDLPLPPATGITVQHLLDHVSGLPSDSPIAPDGGLWLGFKPGTHWSYSNTGYEILGQLAERVGGQPLGDLLKARLIDPTGMSRSLGAILGRDRARYAQGYEAANSSIPYARGAPLAPAPWVDVTFGAGSVASTGDDMVKLMHSLFAATAGRGGLGLDPEQGRAFTAHAVPSDSPAMSYGNGLMHVASAGRSYLHHTGGMVSFSSSFHLDKASGTGAFASTNLTAFAEYRPRTLTLFAVDALTNALAGKALPMPPRLDIPVPSTGSYVGHYAGPSGDFRIEAGAPLSIVAGGRSVPLQPWGGELFRTLHPDFRRFTLKFERTGHVITGASWGPSSFVRAGSAARIAPPDPALARLAGRYTSDDPWYGTMNIVERGGKLWIGTETPLTLIGANSWRVGQESWSPERASFANPIDGRPAVFIYSGEIFHRRDG